MPKSCSFGCPWALNGGLQKTHPDHEPMKFFVYFLTSFFISLFFFYFFIFLARSDKRRYPPTDNERHSAAEPEWSDGSWATPRDASWSIPPGNRPTGKHLASWGITYQMEPGYVLVDSQKSCRLRWEGATYSLPAPTRQELADSLQMSRCVTADSDAAARLETAESLESGRKKEGRRKTGLTANTVSPSGENMLNSKWVQSPGCKPQGIFIHVTEPH